MGKLNVGGWIVDDKTCRLIKGEYEQVIQFRVMALLQFFAARPNQVLSKEEIAEEVWKGVVVSDDAIVNAVVKLRKALGDTSKNSKYIETIPKVGYRFIASIGNQSIEKPNIVKSTSSSRFYGAVLAAVFLMFLVVNYINYSKQFPEDKITNTLAVLPLLNLSGGRDNDYFADGLTEELINTFSQQTQLSVTARASSFAFKNTEQPLHVIAEQLNVRYLLQGSIRRYDDLVRVSIQLIDAHSLKQVLSNDYDENVKNIITLQDSIARQVTQSLSEIFPLDLVEVKSRFTNDINANDLYWLGHHQLKTRTITGIDKAVRTFTQLVEKHNNNDIYLLALAEAYIVKSGYTAEKSEPLLAEALALLREADAVITDDIKNKEIWGLYYLSNNDLPRAIESLEWVVNSSKNNARARMWLGQALQNKGNIIEARKWLEEGRKLDPLNPTLIRLLARNILRGGKFQQGVQLLIQASDSDSSSAQLELELARWAFNYRQRDALKWATIANEKEPEQIESKIALAYGYLQQNELTKAKFYLNEAQQAGPQNPLVFNASANFYMVANQRQQLIAYINSQENQVSKLQGNEQVNYQSLWRGVVSYYQQQYEDALIQFDLVLANENANPIEQVEATIFAALVFSRIDNKIQQNQYLQRALEQIKLLHDKGWGMPYLLASQYVIYSLQKNTELLQNLVSVYPQLTTDFKNYIQMHDAEL